MSGFLGSVWIEPLAFDICCLPKKNCRLLRNHWIFSAWAESHLASRLNCFSHAYFVSVLLVCCRLWQQRGSRHEYLVAALPPEKPPAVPHMLPASTSLTLGPAALSLVGFLASLLIGRFWVPPAGWQYGAGLGAAPEVRLLPLLSATLPSPSCLADFHVVFFSSSYLWLLIFFMKHKYTNTNTAPSAFHYTALILLLQFWCPTNSAFNLDEHCSFHTFS